MSMSYPARTAFFCSAIFMVSRSVIFLLIVLIASLWSILRICSVTMRPSCVSMKSARIRSLSSGARICRKEAAPSFFPMRNILVFPNWNEDGAI